MLFVRELPDGRTLVVLPLLWGYASLALGRPGQSWFYDTWQYQSRQAALDACLEWNGEPGTEPTGWYKHPATGRRRPDGDPAREYVAE